MATYIPMGPSSLQQSQLAQGNQRCWVLLAAQGHRERPTLQQGPLRDCCLAGRSRASHPRGCMEFVHWPVTSLSLLQDCPGLHRHQLVGGWHHSGGIFAQWKVSWPFTEHGGVWMEWQEGESPPLHSSHCRDVCLWVRGQGDWHLLPWGDGHSRIYATTKPLWQTSQP